jgi:hypothetical protein
MKTLARVPVIGGVCLLVIGAAVGWLLPPLASVSSLFQFAQTRLPAGGLDISGYLGAYITVVALLVAVVTGSSATTLQVATQSRSASQLRALIQSLLPFLGMCGLAIGIALLYYLMPPTFAAQLWQLLIWLGAVALFMLDYLVVLPYYLSAEYLALQAIRQLRRTPMHTWESLDAYSSLPVAISEASAHNDMGGVRVITHVLGQFLIGIRDQKAEAAPGYERGRYRALKNLLTGSAQMAPQAPNAVVYNLGYVLAGVLLQAVAVGHVLDDPDHDLFTGLFRTLRGSSEKLTPLWTGLRHALCRESEDEPPYLLRFWLARTRWPSDDPRRVIGIATVLALFYARCWGELREARDPAGANTEAAEMIADLYRDIATHLGPRVARERQPRGAIRLPDLPLGLLDAVHAHVMSVWPATAAEQSRVQVVNAYEQRRQELMASIDTR